MRGHVDNHTDDRTLAAALGERVDNLMSGEGSVTFPAVPAMIDTYTDRCVAVFAAVGRPFSGEERGHLREVLARTLAEAHAFSQRSSITITYRSHPAEPLTYAVRCNLVTLEQAYHEWTASRAGPLFGAEPDARVWALAAGVADPPAHPVLDIGAGTGRNALALARRGHPVDAAEPTDDFARAIEAAAQQESLNVRVIRRDVLDPDCYLRPDYSMVVLSGVVSEFRTARQLRGMFELAARHLVTGGHLVFNVFVTEAGYVPSDAARQFAQQSYSGFFTPDEIAVAAAGLSLDLVADDSVHVYEKEHLPAGVWPPTSWYVNWVTGRDVFGPAAEACPIELRWLVYRKN